MNVKEISKILNKDVAIKKAYNSENIIYMEKPKKFNITFNVNIREEGRPGRKYPVGTFYISLNKRKEALYTGTYEYTLKPVDVIKIGYAKKSSAITVSISDKRLLQDFTPTEDMTVNMSMI